MRRSIAFVSLMTLASRPLFLVPAFFSAAATSLAAASGSFNRRSARTRASAKCGDVGASSAAGFLRGPADLEAALRLSAILLLGFPFLRRRPDAADPTHWFAAHAPA